MITNLLASVVITLITNVVPSDNAKWEQSRTVFYPEGGGPSEITKEATELYLTTNVVEHVEVTLMLPEGPHTFTKDRTISSVTAVMRKLEQWQPAGVRTNISSSAFMWLTNWVGEPSGEPINQFRGVGDLWKQHLVWKMILNAQTNSTWISTPQRPLELSPSGSTQKAKTTP